MSRLKQPIFEKPEEPDFIKRLKQGQIQEKLASERPMTDAPVLEDELPAIANEFDVEDIEQIRKMHGVQKAAPLPVTTLSGLETGTISPNINLSKEKSRVIKEERVGLGSRIDIKQRVKLQALKSKRRLACDGRDEGIGAGREEIPRPAGIQGVAKVNPKKRVKMKMSFD